ncbi:MAG: flavodoxin domain-containing protein, partial [Spirochaetia bacterium]
DKNDVVAEVFKSKAVVFGSPTINRGILTSLAGLLEEIKGLSFKDKKAAVFGSYGWSGESTRILAESLQQAGFTVVDDGLKMLWNPSEQSIEECVSYGQKLAKELS